MENDALEFVEVTLRTLRSANMLFRALQMEEKVKLLANPDDVLATVKDTTIENMVEVIDKLAQCYEEILENSQEEAPREAAALS